MAIDILSIPLTGGGTYLGYDYHDYFAGENLNNNQIVTLTDGGNISGTVTLKNFGLGTPTEVGAEPGGNDRFEIDLSTFNDNFTIKFHSFDTLDTIQVTGWTTRTDNGNNTYTYTYTGTDGMTHTVTVDARDVKDGSLVNVVCFARGTEIQTRSGQVPVEDLCAGDRVKCGDGLLRPIRWVGSRTLDEAELTRHPDLRPMIIRRDAFGAGAPRRRLLLSPQHKIRVSDWRAALLFGEDNILAAAKHLCDDQTVRQRRSCEPVEYFHILLDQHDTVFANGLEVETLHPGEVMKTALDGEARSEICAIFPDLATDLNDFGVSVGVTLGADEARVLTAWPLAS